MHGPLEPLREVRDDGLGFVGERQFREMLGFDSERRQGRAKFMRGVRGKAEFPHAGRLDAGKEVVHGLDEGPRFGRDLLGGQRRPAVFVAVSHFFGRTLQGPEGEPQNARHDAQENRKQNEKRRDRSVGPRLRLLLDHAHGVGHGRIAPVREKNEAEPVFVPVDRNVRETALHGVVKAGDFRLSARMTHANEHVPTRGNRHASAFGRDLRDETFGRSAPGTVAVPHVAVPSHTHTAVSAAAPVPLAFVLRTALHFVFERALEGFGRHRERPGNAVHNVRTGKRRRHFRELHVLRRKRVRLGVAVGDVGGRGRKGKERRNERRHGAKKHRAARRKDFAENRIGLHDAFSRMRQPRPRMFSIASLPIFLRSA